MAHRIELARSAVKELERLLAKTHEKIIEHLVQIEETHASSDRKN